MILPGNVQKFRDMETLPCVYFISVKGIADLKQEVSHIFLQQSGFIWEQRRIAISNMQPWWATCKSTKTEEIKLFYRRERKLGRPTESPCCTSQLRMGVRAPLSGLTILNEVSVYYLFYLFILIKSFLWNHCWPRVRCFLCLAFCPSMPRRTFLGCRVPHQGKTHRFGNLFWSRLSNKKGEKRDLSGISHLRSVS